MGSYIKRFTGLVFGLFLCAVGIYVTVQANVGLAPWDVFNQGLGGLTGITMGNISILVGIVIIGGDYFLGEKIGFGTILNAILIGVFFDFLVIINPMPTIDHLAKGILIQLAGLLLIALGSYFYIGAGMGCGPRDSLMVALCKRFPNTPVGVIRAALEGTVLIAGALCGGTIGIGTVVAVFGMGSMIQATFQMFHFDVKTVTHETVLETLQIWAGKKQ